MPMLFSPTIGPPSTRGIGSFGCAAQRAARSTRLIFALSTGIVTRRSPASFRHCLAAPADRTRQRRTRSAVTDQHRRRNADGVHAPDAWRVVGATSLPLFPQKPTFFCGAVSVAKGHKATSQLWRLSPLAMGSICFTIDTKVDLKIRSSALAPTAL